MYPKTQGNQGSTYTGKNDPTLDFGDANHFGDADASNHKFIVTIKNTTDADKVIAINQAFNGGVAGNTVDGVITDGVIIEGVTGTGSPKLIEDFKHFISTSKAVQITKMKIVSTDATQLQKAFNLVRKSPFKNEQNRIITIADHTSQGDLNTLMVMVNEELQLDTDTDLSVPVVAGSTITITLYVGAVLDMNKSLQIKTNTASLNPAVAGLKAARKSK